MSDDPEKIANVSLQQRADLMAEIERRDAEVKYWKAINNQHVAEIERLRTLLDEQVAK